MLHKLTLIVLLSLSVGYSSAQQDTLSLEEIDTVFSALNPELFNGALLDRSWMDDAYVDEQKWGNYDQIHDNASFLSMLNVFNASILNTNTAENMSAIVQGFFDYFGEENHDQENRNSQIPFCLILNDAHWIDSNALVDGKIIFEDYRIKPIVDEELLYRHQMLLSGAPFNTDNNFDEEDELIFDDRFIFTSSNISLLSIEIDFGNGFESLSEDKSIKFPMKNDENIAKARVQYQIDSIVFIDTLSFYTYNKDTTNAEFQAKGAEASVHLLTDSENDWQFVEDEGIQFNVNVMPHCGFDRSDPSCYVSYDGHTLPKIKRPIILISPYSPGIQKDKAVTTVGLFNQFNTGNVFVNLSNLGYDIIVVENEDAHEAVAKCGRDFGRLLYKINEWKELSYPNESWENTIIGYSMGGQVAKYALMWMEKKHMDEGTPHHHTRLYVSYDSPHHGGRVLMSSQSIYHSFASSGNVAAMLAFKALIDNASLSMIEPHIESNILSFSQTSLNRDIYNTTSRTTIRQDLLNDFYTNFQHAKSNGNDERRPFPAFTRNVAITMASRNKDYTDEYQLTPGQLYFEQNGVLKNRKMYASSYGNARPSFTRFDIIQSWILQFQVHHKYRTFGISEWDIAQSGYKDEFYNGWLNDVAWGLPVGGLSIVQQSYLMLGNTHYEGRAAFMPLVSSLAINPSIWANNNLYFNTQSEGLMYEGYNSSGALIESEFYGYPNLGNPNHFDITPFEAIYADDQTYEHIKPLETIAEQGFNDNYLDSIAIFIVREVEDDIVCLQNYDLGANHNNWYANDQYEAWYKARKEVKIGREVTPKTDIGDYNITNHGNLTVYAGEQVVMKPGFHAQAGSHYHAYIDWNDCYGCSGNSGMAPIASGSDIDAAKIEMELADTKPAVAAVDEKNIEVEEFNVYPNPNQGEFTVVLPKNRLEGWISITDLSGKGIYNKYLQQNSTNLSLSLSRGVYIIKLKDSSLYKKIIIQ